MKKPARTKSLAKVLFTWGLITAIFLLFISIQIGVNVSEKRIKTEAESMGRIAITRIAFIAERTIQKDRFLLKDLIAQVATDQRLQDILILDPQRKVVYSNRHVNIGRSIIELPSSQQSILRNQERQGAMVPYVEQEKTTLSFAKSFIWPPAAGQIRSNQQGYVLLLIDLEAVKEDRWLDVMNEQLLISGVYIFALMLLLIGVFFSIKEPLRTLTVAAGRFRQGDFNFQVKEPSIGEMRELAQSFNMMSAEIQHQISALQSSENTFRDLIEHSPIGIVTFDSNGRQIYQNRAFVKITGLSPEHLTDMTEDEFEATIKTLEEKNLDQSIANKLSHLRTPFTDNDTARIIEIYNPDLRVILRFQIHLSNSKIRSILYFQDITTLSKIDRMKSEFITTAAHELRTPMTTILGYAELLLSRPTNDTQRLDMTSSIHKQAQSIVHLLDELLDVALIETRADRAFKMKESNIAPLVESLAHDFMVTGDPRKITLLPIPRLANVLIDSEKIGQALKNCLSNAYKFSTPDSEIILQAAMYSKDELVISVRDFGIGMTADVQDKIFEKFFRADSSGHIPGTGLGMTLVKQIMHHHHGRIEIESELGKGTCINLFLPVISQAK